ncbi:two-component sensor histidine kinase [Virgisporangium aliadipatigenens]|uniref:histidine kinase n=1 Tax=Virgisporangium aliadipatigenens TaxID=741659 RepID=A0A8J4DRD0_9ACTN|nr:sensor histidine kinase [Virgisporangium aliadipatigenens]GIJ47529.1 two-component sensor histidine kinase [Virgisporangium aliadipatigenens]
MRDEAREERRRQQRERRLRRGLPPDPPWGHGARGDGNGPARQWHEEWAHRTRERHDARRRRHDRLHDRWPPGPGLDGPPWARRISPQMVRRVLQARERQQRHSNSSVAALVAGVVHVLGTRVALGEVPEMPTLALLLVGPLALLVRKRAPELALLVALAAALAFTLPHGIVAPVFLAPLFALVHAVQEGKRRAARWILLAGYAVYVFAGRLLPETFHLVSWSRALAAGGVVWATYLFAEGSRARNLQVAALARIVEEEERAEAEQKRAAEEQQRRQASEERLRIAQELHDVLGHHLSLINVRAGVGLHIMDEHPEEARASLAAIKEASAEALREVRAVLASLRVDEDAAAPRAPTAGLGALDALLAAADPPVPLKVEGTARDLPPDVDRAAYRIMQEALTNVRRHAGPDARATATVRYLPDAVEIAVRDDGQGVPPEKLEAGNGLAGMRERAAALGGSLRAGPRAGGGFEVVAVLPLPKDSLKGET